MKITLKVEMPQFFPEIDRIVDQFKDHFTSFAMDCCNDPTLQSKQAELTNKEGFRIGLILIEKEA